MGAGLSVVTSEGAVSVTVVYAVGGAREVSLPVVGCVVVVREVVVVEVVVWLSLREMLFRFTHL